MYSESIMKFSQLFKIAAKMRQNIHCKANEKIKILTSCKKENHNEKL